MRFRKKISICKGVKLNLSKSGVSCTVGGKGLSLNLGKGGVFLNTSLPGTGLYDRHKLIDGKSFKKLGSKKTAAREEEIDVRNYELALDDGGSIAILKASGAAASEEEARKVRRTDWYEEQSAALLEQFREEVEAQTAAFVSIYRQSKKVAKAGAIEEADAVEEKLDAWLQELELPMSFDVEYEYNPENGSVLLDLDLPEIEDIPEDKVIELASGAIRAKDKTQKEIKEEYRTCVFGLAVFFASHVFDLSEGTRNVLVSGYTQRRDKRTGELEDCYVLSVVFEREAFETSKCTREDPFDFCDQFRSRLNMLASGELKEIVPYTAEEFAAMLEE